MATPSKTKSRFEQLLSEIYPRRPRENNKRVCIDCLKPRSNKNEFEYKNRGCTEFYVRLSKFFICNIVQFVMYKKAVLSKIKPHSDAVDYFKELPFYNKPIAKPKVKPLKKH